ncbi:MAG TPA: peptidylprolyl isomerase [Candidatus Binataceae bacterium]
MRTKRRLALSDSLRSWNRAAIVCAIITLLAMTGDARGEDLDRVIASVDGDPITVHDLKVYSAANGIQLTNPGDPNSDETVRQTLKGLITQKMMEQELKNYADRASDEQVDRYIDKLREKNNLSEEAFKNQVMHQGISWDEFRKRAKTELEKMNMLDAEVRQKVNIPPEQIQAYYDSHKEEFRVEKERYKLAQILVAVDFSKASPDQVKAAKKKAKELQKRAAAGDDFAELAAQNSDDDSKTKGGELGDFAPDDMLDEIRAGVEKVETGHVSDVIQTKYGLHIIKVEEHDKPGLKPVGEVKEQIQDKLTEAAGQGRMKEWLEKDLIKNHHVESAY